MKNPFAPSRIPKKRDTPRRIGPDRVKLTGEAKTELRRQAFERSEGFCENQAGLPARCGVRITWESMELSHLAHGPRRDDSLDGVLASCAECHRNQHNAGGKPCPKKPGSVMSLTKANKYWHGQCCFCERWKRSKESFCSECMPKLQPQTRYDLENAMGRDYCEALARGELEIIAADVRAKVEAKTA